MSMANTAGLKKTIVPVLQPDGSLGSGNRYVRVIPRETAGSVSAGPSASGPVSNPFAAAAAGESEQDAIKQYRIAHALKAGTVPVDWRGFFPSGVHIRTGERFDDGGWDREEVNETTGELHDLAGFNIIGWHKVTGTRFDGDGRDRDGHDLTGRDRDGNHWSTDSPIDYRGFGSNGLLANGERYDENGWDVNEDRADGSRFVDGLDFDGCPPRAI